MSQPFFITGTGTCIGKTLVTTALCAQLRQQGKTVTALKPVVTGFNSEDAASDTALILQSCGLTPTPAMINTVSPWRFKAPLAPNLAAAKEGRSIAFDEVAAFCREHAALESDIVLIEGAGGVMAPLNDTHTALDLMQELAWPVILATASYLGAISHTLTAMEALHARRLPIRALVMSESDASAVTLDDTVAALSPFVPADIPLVKLPRLRVKSELWKHAPPISWICD